MSPRYLPKVASNRLESDQATWFYTTCINLIMDVLIISSFRVFAKHYVIPASIRIEVNDVKEKFLQEVEEFKKQGQNPCSDHDHGGDVEDSINPSFDVAKYFSVSQSLSLMYDVPESIVLQRQQIDHVKSVKEVMDRHRAADENSRCRTFRIWSYILSMLFMQVLSSMPLVLQDMLLDQGSTVASGFLVDGLYSLYNVNPYLLLTMILPFLMSFFSLVS